MHGRGRCRIGVALLALAVCGPAGVEASAVTYEFGGVVTSGDPSAGIAAGMRFSGTFSLDPQELSRGGYGLQGDASYSVAPTASPASESMTVSFAGGPTFTLPPGSLGVNVWEQGLSGWGSPSGEPLTGTQLIISGTLPGGIPIQLDLFNPAQTLDPTLAVPSPIRLGDYPTAQLQELAPLSSITVAPGSPLFVGTITSLEPMATPEPTTLLILGPALAGWLALRRSRADQPTHREG
jgi:hypothetical protein